MSKRTSYARSYPVVTGETVTEGHAQWCRDFGHGTWTIEGVVQPRCPRCDEPVSRETAPAAPAAPAEVPSPLTHQRVADRWLPRPRQWQLVDAVTAEVLVAGPLTHPEASREWDRLTAEGRAVRIAPAPK